MAHGQSNDISTVLNYRKNLDPTTNLLKHNACPSHRKTSKKKKKCWLRYKDFIELKTFIFLESKKVSLT